MDYVSDNDSANKWHRERELPQPTKPLPSIILLHEVTMDPKSPRETAWQQSDWPREARHERRVLLFPKRAGRFAQVMGGGVLVMCQGLASSYTKHPTHVCTHAI